MTPIKLNHGPSEVLEAKRIAEIKALSYIERLERMFALIELSYKVRTAKKNKLKQK